MEPEPLGYVHNDVSGSEFLCQANGLLYILHTPVFPSRNMPPRKGRMKADDGYSVFIHQTADVLFVAGLLLRIAQHLHTVETEIRREAERQLHTVFGGEKEPEDIPSSNLFSILSHRGNGCSIYVLQSALCNPARPFCHPSVSSRQAQKKL